MRFSVAAVSAALLGAALAAPAPNPDPRETVQIKDFVATRGKVAGAPADSISLKLMSHRAEGVAAYVCNADDGPAGLKTKQLYKCQGEEGWKYYGFLINSVGADNVFNLTMLHATAPAFGFWGYATVPTVCSADGQTCKTEKTLDVELHIYG